MNITCRKPCVRDFSFVRSVENSSGNGWWMRRPIRFIFGIAGHGWYFGFIKHDKDETIINETLAAMQSPQEGE